MINIGRVLSRSGSRRHAAISKSISVRTSVFLKCRACAGVQGQGHRALLSTQTQTPPALEYEDNKILPAFRLASEFSERTALRDEQGEYSYRGLLLSSNQLSSQVAAALGRPAPGLRLAFLGPNNANYIIAQWATWMGGHTTVPLYPGHPASVQQYYIEDSDAALLLVTPEFAERGQQLAQLTGRPVLVVENSLSKLAMKMPPLKPLPHLCDDIHEEMLVVGGGDQQLVLGQPDQFYAESDAMMLYTSGTTGKPKGVVLTHSNLHHQVSSLCQAWEISSKDVVLHTLPLHHMHGIVNALLCPLYVGAKVVMMPQFDSSMVWKHLLAIKVPAKDRINFFTAVPTIYMKLLKEYDEIFAKNERMKEYIKAACQKNVRLMISGSASLPAPVFERWEEVTGHRLLERYGMTEVGMALSNPLRGERIPGFVGTPLPHVQARVAQFTAGRTDYQTMTEGNSHGTRILQPGAREAEGELLLRGPNVFRCYWNKPKATAKEFTTDGWFKTGDTVQYVEGKGYRVLGRTSVDIIKTGGYKVSALEVETLLLGHPNIVECAVVGVPDITWGQKVAAVAVVKEGSEMTLQQLREWAKEHLPPYSIPTLLHCVQEIPKNAMGKVNKKELVATLFPELQATTP